MQLLSLILGLPCINAIASKVKPRDVNITTSFLSSGLPHQTGAVDTNDCWTSWVGYWSSYRQVESAGGASYSCLVNSTETWNYNTQPFTTSTFTSTWQETSVIYNGDFPITTTVWPTTSTVTSWSRGSVTDEKTSVFCASRTLANVPTPSCTLPTLVSQCEQQWESTVSQWLQATTPAPPKYCDIYSGVYSTNGLLVSNPTLQPCASSYWKEWSSSTSANPTPTSPACTQASIGGELCSSVRDNYMTKHAVPLMIGMTDTVGQPVMSLWSAGHFGYARNGTTTWTWPSESTIGRVPSCTLGCGRCAVTGGTVDLIYWASQTKTANASQAVTAAPVTVETLGTTLTSPTIYISYSGLFARDNCGMVGTNVSRTIVAIPTDQTLSTIYAGPGACTGQLHWTNIWSATAALTLSELDEPVPRSIYNAMPVCASSLYCGGSNATCNAGPYKPILVVPEAVLQSMQPAWATCSGDVRGQYDPPVKLTATSSAAGFTLPNAAKTTSDVERVSATPASSPILTTAPATTSSEPAATATGSEQSSQNEQSPEQSSKLGEAPANTKSDDIATPTEGSENSAASPDESDASSDPAASSTDVVAASTSPNIGGIIASVIGMTDSSKADPVSDNDAAPSSIGPAAPIASNVEAGAATTQPDSMKPSSTNLVDPEDISGHEDAPSQAAESALPNGNQGSGKSDDASTNTKGGEQHSSPAASASAGSSHHSSADGESSDDDSPDNSPQTHSNANAADKHVSGQSGLPDSDGAAPSSSMKGIDNLIGLIMTAAAPSASGLSASAFHGSHSANQGSDSASAPQAYASQSQKMPQSINGPVSQSTDNALPGLKSEVLTSSESGGRKHAETISGAESTIAAQSGSVGETESTTKSAMVTATATDGTDPSGAADLASTRTRKMGEESGSISRDGSVLPTQTTDTTQTAQATQSTETTQSSNAAPFSQFRVALHTLALLAVVLFLFA